LARHVPEALVMSHPLPERLALLASNDVPWFERARLRWHVGRCPACASEVRTFQAARQLAASEDLPAGLDWNRLSAEMTANIRLGLAAGECVAELPSEQAGFFRPAFAVASVAALLYGATWVYGLRNRPVPPVPGVLLEAAADGIAVQENGARLALIHSGSGPESVSVGAGGSLRASYIDDDADRVTIHHVYAQ
jgi:hypothetical protein